MADDHVKVKLPQLTPYPLDEVLPEDLIFVWEAASGVLRRASVSQLPFGSGGGTTTLLGSPFKARVGDESVEIVEVSPGVYNTVISDIRLLDKNDFPVNSTQVQNAGFRDSQIEYDPINGIVTIKNFQLLSSEYVILYPDGVPASSSSGGSFDKLKEEVEFMKLILAPYYPTVTGANGGRMIWMKPADQVPVGWVSDDNFAGKVPAGFQNGDADFGGNEGSYAGAKTYTLITENLPDFTFSNDYFQMMSSDWRSGGAPSPTNGTGQNGTRNKTYTGGKQAFKIIQPSIIVRYIRFEGI